MRLPPAELEAYLARVAELLERYGVVLDLAPSAPLQLDESPSGALSFALRGFLPDGRMPPQSILEIRERWIALGSGEVERSEYAYELLDHERGFRRAFHLHDPEDFVRRYDVVVHEHCERPMGTTACAHVQGSPVRDGYHGVEVLLKAWIDPDVPDCANLPCLDA